MNLLIFHLIIIIIMMIKLKGRIIIHQRLEQLEKRMIVMMNILIVQGRVKG